MGGEFAQYAEWDYKRSLDWHLLASPLHAQLQRMLADLNALYRSEPALYSRDVEREGFEWIDDGDYQHNCITFMRKSADPEQTVYVVCNFADETRENYLIGLPQGGAYREIFNSQDKAYEGWNIGNEGLLYAEAATMHGRPFRLALTLPPLGVIYLKKAAE